jgi:hypothetical protein
MVNVTAAMYGWNCLGSGSKAASAAHKHNPSFVLGAARTCERMSAEACRTNPCLESTPPVSHRRHLYLTWLTCCWDPLLTAFAPSLATAAVPPPGCTPPGPTLPVTSKPSSTKMRDTTHLRLLAGETEVIRASNSDGCPWAKFEVSAAL